MNPKILLLLLILVCCIGKTEAQIAAPLSDSSIEELDEKFHQLKKEKRYSEIIPYMRAAVAKAKQDYGSQDTVYARMLYQLGVAYDYTEHYKESIELYEQARLIQEEQNPLSKDFANTLNAVGYYYHHTGEYDDALQLYIEAKEIREEVLGVEHPDYAISLNNLGYLYHDISEYDKALFVYIQAKEVREKVLGKEHPDYATSLNNLAYLYHDIGELDKALPLYIQALDIDEKNYGAEGGDYAMSLNNLAHLYHDMENYDKALPLFIKAVEIQKKEYGFSHFAYAFSLHSLAYCYGNMKNYDKALPLYNQALNIQAKVLGREHWDYSITLNNLAYAYKDIGEYDKALPLYIESKNINKKVLGTKHPDYILSLNNLASLHKEMGEYDQAKSYLIEAIQATSSTNIPWDINPTWANYLAEAEYTSYHHLEMILTSLACVYELLENDQSTVNVKEKQQIVVDLAIELNTQLLDLVSNEKDKLRALKQSSQWVHKGLMMLDSQKNYAKAFSLIDQNKSVLLLQANKLDDAYKLGNLPKDLVLKDKKMSDKQTELQARLNEHRPKSEKDSLRTLLNSLNADMMIFEKTLKEQYPKYYQLKHKKVETKIEEIQELLDAQTALIEYVITDSLIHIFYVDQETIQWEKSLVANKKLKRHIQKLRAALSDYELIAKQGKLAYQQYTEHAHWFYQNLIASVLEGKKHIKNLVIVTDGELGHLPFETFLLEEAAPKTMNYSDLHYLVQDYNISYNYSAALWKENKTAAKPSNNGQLLALAANYDIQLKSSMSTKRLAADRMQREMLDPLPAARKEVEMLQEKYLGVFAFDTLASERMVKEKAADFAILHFATHGILNNQRPMLSALALTENSDSTESNFWQAHEISKMNLNTDLVVLSACQTGYGKFEEGNGIASLARAFMYANASALVVSLWQVNDNTTSEIMKNFYANLSNDMYKDQALRQAKLKYIQAAKGIAAHPAFWSPFIMIGNTTAIDLKTKTTDDDKENMLWLTGGLLASLTIGGGIWARRRKK